MDLLRKEFVHFGSLSITFICEPWLECQWEIQKRKKKLWRTTHISSLWSCFFFFLEYGFLDQYLLQDVTQISPPLWSLPQLPTPWLTELQPPLPCSHHPYITHMHNHWHFLYTVLYPYRWNICLIPSQIHIPPSTVPGKWYCLMIFEINHTLYYNVVNSRWH